MQIVFLSHCWHVLLTFLPKCNGLKCNGCWRGTENIKSPILPPLPPQKKYHHHKTQNKGRQQKQTSICSFSQDGSQIFTCVAPSCSKCERHFPLPPSTAGKDQAFFLFSAAPCGAGNDQFYTMTVMGLETCSRLSMKCSFMGSEFTLFKKIGPSEEVICFYWVACLFNLLIFALSSPPGWVQVTRVAQQDHQSYPGGQRTDSAEWLLGCDFFRTGSGGKQIICILPASGSRSLYSRSDDPILTGKLFGSQPLKRVLIRF